jgi:hypothetical protein
VKLDSHLVGQVSGKRGQIFKRRYCASQERHLWTDKKGKGEICALA